MGTDISMESKTDISKDDDEVHTANINFTYKTFIFGGTEQAELGATNPYIAPITKISAEVHMVPYLEQDQDDVGYNPVGKLGADDPNLGKEMSIENYVNKLDKGQIPYPEYEMIDWILDY